MRKNATFPSTFFTQFFFNHNKLLRRALWIYLMVWIKE